MKRTRPLLRPALLVLLAPSLLGAQEVRPLTAGSPVEATLSIGQSHAYELELDAGLFVVGWVDQIGVPVAVAVERPDGASAGRFAIPLGPGAPQAFSFTTEAAGPHRIAVSSRAEDRGGAYRILVGRVEPTATTPEGRVDQALAVLRPDTPGGIVAVIRDGEVVFEQAAGAANLEHGVPFTGATPTNIGSTSKQFTGFALALLHARGELSLDDDVRDYLPELKDFGTTITLRHLLSHTTGFREFVNTLLMGGRQVLEADHIAREEVVAVVNRQPSLQNAPGAEFNYNNSAFGLATLVVERVTGRSFPEWMEEEVFRPLGMDHTRVRADPGELIPGRAAGYLPSPLGFKETRDLGASMGAGGIYTTPRDLARWMGNLGSGALGGEEVIRELTTPYVLTSGEATGYGLGLFMDERRGLARWQHGGSDIAHRSTFVYFPELDAGYVVLSNYAGFPGSIGNLVAEAFFGEYMEPAPSPSGPGQRAGGGDEAREEEEEVEPAPDLAPYAGRYFSEELETFYDLVVEDRELVIRHRRFGRAPLTHSEGDVFTGTLPVTRMEFERDDAGRITGFRAGNVRARDIRFERVGPS